MILYFATNNPRMNIQESNTILFKIITQDDQRYDVNDFIELFVDEGPFNESAEHIFGVSVHNYYSKIYAVNFAETTPISVMENFLNTFETPQNLTTPYGKPIALQTSLPRKPLKLVTIFPMPFGITKEQVDTITGTWGELVKFEYGRHKRFPAFRNAYLHVYFKTIEKQNIPDTIKVNNRNATVMMQGEEHIPRCWYCKKKNHTTALCPILPTRPQNPQSTYTRPKSYSTAIQQSNNYAHISPTLPHLQINSQTTSQSIFSPNDFPNLSFSSQPSPQLMKLSPTPAKENYQQINQELTNTSTMQQTHTESSQNNSENPNNNENIINNTPQTALTSIQQTNPIPHPTTTGPSQGMMEELPEELFLTSSDTTDSSGNDSEDTVKDNSMTNKNHPNPKRKKADHSSSSDTRSKSTRNSRKKFQKK